MKMNDMRIAAFAAVAFALLVGVASAQFQLPGIRPLGATCNPTTNPPQNCLPGLRCDTSGGGLGGGGRCATLCTPFGLSCNPSIQGGANCCLGLSCITSGVPGAGGRCGVPAAPPSPPPGSIGQPCVPNAFDPTGRGTCRFGLVCSETTPILYNCRQPVTPSPTPTPSPPSPPAELTLLAAANENPDLSTFIEAVIAANLTSVVDEIDTPVTVLAPTNDAFNALLADLNLESLAEIPPNVLQQVLLFHIIQYINTPSNQLLTFLPSTSIPYTGVVPC